MQATRAGSRCRSGASFARCRIPTTASASTSISGRCVRLFLRFGFLVRRTPLLRHREADHHAIRRLPVRSASFFPHELEVAEPVRPCEIHVCSTHFRCLAVVVCRVHRKCESPVPRCFGDRAFAREVFDPATDHLPRQEPGTACSSGRCPPCRRRARAPATTRRQCERARLRAAHRPLRTRFRASCGPPFVLLRRALWARTKAITTLPGGGLSKGEEDSTF